MPFIRKYIYIGSITAIIFCLLFIDLSEASYNLVLKGTVFTRSLKPLAIIQDLASGKINMYEAGETIGSVRILEIRRAEVILQEGQNQYILAMPYGGVSQPSALVLDVNKKGEILYVNKNDVTKALSVLPQLVREIKIMPYFNNGKPQGLRLSSIKDGSIFEKAGVRSGDVVKSINGMTLNSPAQVFLAYKKLKSEKNFKVDILRNEKNVVLSYAIE